MITNSDWQDAYRQTLDDGRSRIDPPSAEKIEELMEGKLPEEEAESVREALSYYPELLRIMTEPMPADPSSVVTDEEVAAGIARLRKRLRDESPTRVRRRRPIRRILTAAAAVVLVAAGILAYRRSHRFEGSPVLLSADGELGGSSAGGQTPHQLLTETDYLLEPAFLPDRRFADYKLELLDLSGDVPRIVDSWTGVRQKPDGSFPIPLSTKGLAEGRYRLILYGMDGQPVRLAAYTIRLNRR